MEKHELLAADILAFFDGRLREFELYSALENMLRRRMPDLEIRAAKTQISFFAGRMFGCASMLRLRKKAEMPDAYIVVSFSLPEPITSGLIDACVEVGKNRWTHHVVVSDEAQLGGELMDCLQRAYEFARRL